MLKNFNLFPSSMGRQTLLLLFVGFIIIQFSGFLIYDLYHRYVLHNPGRIVLANRVSQIVRIARVVPREELQQIITAVNNQDLTLSLDPQPITLAIQVKNLNPLRVRHLVDNIRQNKFALSFLLDDGAWLNMKGEFVQSNNLIVFFTVTTLLLMAGASFILCAWAVRRLALPLGDFFNAAKRLSVDVNAPALNESGPVEIKQAIRAFNEMQQQIKRLITNRTQMLAAISHDLRTPITRLKLRAELIDNQQQAQKILHDLEDMEDMIQATLDFAKDDYHEELMERFDIDAFLDALCVDLADAGMAVNYQQNENRLPYFGRPNALKRVLTNLIENAIKYGKTAAVNLVEKDDFIHIELTDQGPGIPEKELEKVFEPFYRIERSRSRETGGAGLGLAVARDIIRAQGGDITLSNVTSGGLKVNVSLPTSSSTFDE